MTTTCAITDRHCTECGNTDWQDIAFRSISLCCSAPVIYPLVKHCDIVHTPR